MMRSKVHMEGLQLRVDEVYSFVRGEITEGGGDGLLQEPEPDGIECVKND